MCLPLLLMLALMPFDELREQVFDQYNRWHPRSVDAQNTVIIDIDEESLAKIGQFPWPRDYFAQILNNAYARGARAVAFDVLFIEPDRTSMREIAPLWQSRTRNDALRYALKRSLDNAAQLPAPDNIFAHALGTTPSIMAMTLTANPTRTTNIKTKIFAHNAKNAQIELPRYPGILANLPRLQAASRGSGIIDTQIDADGLIRDVPLVFSVGEQLYPSLALEAIRVAMGTESFTLAASKNGDLHLQIDKTRIPLARDGTMRVHYAPANSIEHIPAWKLLQSEEGFDSLDGRIVFIGSSAAGLRDIRAHPLNPAVGGVEIHAEIAQSLLNAHVLTRAPIIPLIEIIVCFLIGTGLLVILNRNIIAGIILFGIALVSAGGITAAAYIFGQILIDPLTPALAIGIAMCLMLGGQFAETARERKLIRTAFERYLPPDLLRDVARTPAQLKLGGETRHMTIMFADIRGFSSIAEQFADDPARLTLLINLFLTHMTTIIQAHGGTIDKYIGDCIMAFWNAPTKCETHIYTACRAALAMQAAQGEINDQLRQDPRLADLWNGTLSMGIGLSSGACLVGNIGSEQRFNYSVMGDAVNIAARLETETKTYGMPILVNGDIQSATAGQCACLEIDHATLKGRSRQEHIFALLDDAPESHPMQKLTMAQTQFLSAFYQHDWTRVVAYTRLLKKTYPHFAPYYDHMNARANAALQNEMAGGLKIKEKA